MRIAIFIFLVVFAASAQSAQKTDPHKAAAPAQHSAAPKKATSPRLVEVTREDFTKIAELRSSNLTLFGIRLGQTEEQAKAVPQIAGWTWKADDRGKWELRDSNGHGLIVVIIDEGEVTRIGMSPNMSTYLKGDAPQLFSNGILEPTSSIRLSLLGREDEYSHEDSQFSGEWRHYRYFKEGIEINGLSGSPYMTNMTTIDFFKPPKER